MKIKLHITLVLALFITNLSFVYSQSFSLISNYFIFDFNLSKKLVNKAENMILNTKYSEILGNDPCDYLKAEIYSFGYLFSCEHSSVSLSTTYSSGFSYEWYLNDNLIFLANSNELNTSSPGSYKVKVTDANCSTFSASFELKITDTISWTGYEDNDWHRPCNWIPEVVPNNCTDVIIPNQLFHPKISQNAHAKSITIKSSEGAKLFVDESGLLELDQCFSLKSERQCLFNVSKIFCDNVIIKGELFPGSFAQNVSAELFYEGGKGNIYDKQVVFSENILGLTAILEPGKLNIGNGSVIFDISGIPTKMGDAFFNINIGGRFCRFKVNVNEQPTKGFGADITDVDGNVYKTVYIGTQHWMAQNLKVSKFNDGTSIPFISNVNQWSDLTSPAYTLYENNPLYNSMFGKLYNWFSINNIDQNKNVCPTGWHIPSDVEWTILDNYLGGELVSGGKLKEIGTTNWLQPNNGATNEFDFTGLPGGYMNTLDGLRNLGYYGYYWSSSPYNSLNGWIRYLVNDKANFYRITANKKFGFSIRCLRD